MKDIVKNSFAKLSNSNRNLINNEISRLGSVEQRHTNYRRDGMLNFGARQLMGIDIDASVYVIGVGGSPTASA